MSAVSSALSAAMDSLLAAAGETATFRGLPLQVHIDWNQVSWTAAPGRLALEAQPATSVLVNQSALTTAPTAGEVFVDAAGRYHRVTAVRDLGNRWQCQCTVSF